MKPTIVLCSALNLGPLLLQPVDIGPPPGKLVDIGGRRLHVNCTGTGGPTVVLEAGASAFAIDFSLVQPEIARTNRVCSYDRSGYGWSDPGGSQDAGVEVDLHTALQAAGEKPPYVLLGASRGGFYVRLYAARYPDEVVGMVLVDPAHEDRLYTMFEGTPVEIVSLSAEQLRSTIENRSVPIPRRAPQTGSPFDRLPRALYDRRVELDRRLIASRPATMSYEERIKLVEEERVMLATLRDLGKRQEHPLGDRPLIVLTRGVDSDQDLRDARDRLSRISANSRHSVVAGAGHEIHLFEPSAVIKAVQDVLAAATKKIRLAAA